MLQGFKKFIMNGDLVTIAVAFILVIVGAVLFLVVKMYEKAKSARSAEEAAADPTDVDLLIEIRDLLKERSA